MVNVNVIGRLGTDAEILEGKSGKFVSFRFAVSDYNEGEKTTSWFRVTAFDERTIKLVPYLKKGSMLSIMGTESIRLYKDRNGEDQIGRDIRLATFEFVSTGNGEKREGTETAEPAVTTGKLTKKTSVPEVAVAAAAKADSNVEDTEDDLPF